MPPAELWPGTSRPFGPPASVGTRALTCGGGSEKGSRGPQERSAQIPSAPAEEAIPCGNVRRDFRHS